MADPTARKSTSGYTMLELMIVMAIISFMVMLVMPKVGNGFRGARLKSSVKQFASALRGARAIAVSQKALVVLHVQLGTDEYQFISRKSYRQNASSGKDTSADSRDSSENNTGGNEPSSRTDFQSDLIGKPLHLAEDIVFLDFLVEEGMSVPEEGAIVVFYPRGNCSGGAFVLGIEDGPKYVVTIDRVTGLVRFESVE